MNKPSHLSPSSEHHPGARRTGALLPCSKASSGAEIRKLNTWLLLISCKALDRSRAERGTLSRHGTPLATVKKRWRETHPGTCAATLMDVVSPLHKKSFDEPKALWQCLQIVLTKLFTQIQEFTKKPQTTEQIPHTAHTLVPWNWYTHIENQRPAKRPAAIWKRILLKRLKQKLFLASFPPPRESCSCPCSRQPLFPSSLQAEELQMLEFNSVFLKDFLRTFSALWGVLPQPELLQLKKPLTLSNLKFTHSIRILKKPYFREGLFKLFQHSKTAFVALK